MTTDSESTPPQTDAPTATEPQKHRVTLDWSGAAYERLQALRAEVGASTNAEVIRDALRLYEWYDARRKGEFRHIIEKNGVAKEVVLLFTGSEASSTPPQSDPSADTEKPRHRLPLDFATVAYERLQAVKAAVGASTDGEVIRDAVRLYEWFVAQRKEGWRTLIEKSGVTQEVELFFDRPETSPADPATPG